MAMYLKTDYSKIELFGHITIDMCGTNERLQENLITTVYWGKCYALGILFCFRAWEDHSHLNHTFYIILNWA